MIFRPIFSVTFIIVFVIIIGGGLVWAGMRRTTRTRNLDAGRRALLVAVLAFTCAGPSLPGEAVEVVSNTEVWLVIDRTGSMAAEDWDGSNARIDGVREDVRTIIDAMAGSRLTVLTWDSSLQTILPLTTDRNAVNSFLNTFTQELSESSQGSSPNRPAADLAVALVRAQEENPQNVRTLFVFTDGETSNEDYWGFTTAKESDWDDVAPLIDGGAVIGYGTDEGGPMQVRRLGNPASSSSSDSAQSGDSQSGGAAPVAEEPEYIRDLSQPGNPIAISRIDETALRSIAGRLGVDYIHSPDSRAIASMAADLDRNAQVVTEAREQISTYRYILWPSALIMVALLAWEGWVLAAKSRRMRRSHAI